MLLIEDDARIREIVERGLGSRGFVVTSAEDGLAGLDLARKLDVDVVLLDLMLPGMSGLEVGSRRSAWPSPACRWWR